MAFADSINMYYTIEYDLQRTINRRVPLIMHTCSLSLFDVLTKGHANW